MAQKIVKALDLIYTFNDCVKNEGPSYKKRPSSFYATKRMVEPLLDKNWNEVEKNKEAISKFVEERGGRVRLTNRSVEQAWVGLAYCYEYGVINGVIPNNPFKHFLPHKSRPGSFYTRIITKLTLNKFDERNFDLTRILINLKQNLEIHRVIALNANQIKSNAVGVSFFSRVQTLALESYAINMCKLFEKERGYALNSIHGLLQFIKDNQISLKNVEVVRKFIIMHNKQVEAGDVIETLSLILNEFIKKHYRDLERFKDFRDKRVAHAENILVPRTIQLPNYAVMKELLDFGIDFYFSIQESYGGSGPIRHEHETKVLTSAVFLLEGIGLTNIKKEFDS